MKIFKALFAIIVPVLLVFCIIQKGRENRRTIRETYNYITSSYTLLANDYKEEIANNISVLKHLDWSLPQQEDLEDETLLGKIFSYVKWFTTIIINTSYGIFVPIKCIARSLYLVFEAIYTFVSVVFYISGI